LEAIKKYMVKNNYELLKKQEIPEIKSLAFLYRHNKTGAQILSLVNTMKTRYLV
jgi:Zn-dependent M16 (insulinase) family peptidase